jgi:hypothetical protein
MIASTLVFLGALAGLAILFFVKSYELSREVLLFPKAHAFADDRARLLRGDLMRVSRALEKLPGRTVMMVRSVLHMAAVQAATMASSTEEKLYTLADKVSHKHRFERKYLVQLLKLTEGNVADAARILIEAGQVDGASYEAKLKKVQRAYAEHFRHD